MIVYSAKIQVNENLSKQEFVRLVIQWNQGSPYDKMEGLIWDGTSQNIRYHLENKSLSIEELETHNIIAARFRKEDENKVVWTTDFIFNFIEKTLLIWLDREITETSTNFVFRFSPPHFVKMIIRNGYARDDEKMPVSGEPILIDISNYYLIEEIILRKTKYFLPVVYVTKTWCGNTPVDIGKLSELLQGVAHVLVETDPNVSKILMSSCNLENVHHGGVGIYYPGISGVTKKINIGKYKIPEETLTKKIVDFIFRYNIQQRRERMCTWESVQNEILRLQNEILREKRKAIETENQGIVDVFGEQLHKQEETIKELNNKIVSLTQENQGLRAKLRGMNDVPLLYFGDEADLYEGEIREIILDIFSESLKNQTDKSRRKDVLNDLLKNNDFNNIPEERRNKIKQVLKGYSSLNGSTRQELQKFGFNIASEGKHYKLTYYNDQRYVVTMSKTSGDVRSGTNLAMEICNGML